MANSNAIASPQIGPPPAPNPNPQTQSGGNPLMSPSMGSPMAGGAPGVGPQQQPPPAGAPAPNKQQTVAASIHFMMIERELTDLLQDPSLGKSDLKDKVIDGATKLVGEKILTPAQAVGQLSTFPEKPEDQKTWAQKMFSQNRQAMQMVVAHHAAAFGGQANGGGGPYSPDNHSDIISGLTDHYKQFAQPQGPQGQPNQTVQQMNPMAQ